MLTDAPLVAFVATTDLVRSHAFYAEVLGLRHVETTPFANVYDAGGTTLRVTLVDRVGGCPVHGPRLDGRGHAAAMADELARRGVAFKRYESLDQDAAGVWTAPGGARVAWFRDPDGNVLSVTQPPGPAGGA